MASNNSFSIKKALSFGWNAVKSNPIILFYFFVAMAVPSLVGWGVTMVLGEDSGFNIVLQIVVNIVSLIFSIGLIRLELSVYEKKTLSFSNLYQDYKRVIAYVLASILSGALVLGVIIPFFILIAIIYAVFPDYLWFLVIPGILFFIAVFYVSIRVSFWPYLLVDKSERPLASIKGSWKITKNNAFKIFLLYLMQVLVIILGVIALVLGLIVAIPVASLMMVYVYKELMGNSNNIPSTSVATPQK